MLPPLNGCGGESLVFAVMSDIHANLAAFEACLARLESLARARCLAEIPLVILGDVLDGGPRPAETLALARARGRVFLRGNHEDYLLDHMRNPRNTRYHDPLWRLIPWTLVRLERRELEEFERACRHAHGEWGGRIRFFHASPESNGRSPEFFHAQSEGTDMPPLPAPVDGEAEALCFAGHNHYCGAFENPKHGHGRGREVWINAGSVGYPFVRRPGTDPVATFVVCEAWPRDPLRFHVTFECVEHPRVRLLTDFAESGVIEACTPFSWAILCQCLFNEDVVFPFFQKAKLQGWRQTDLPERLAAHLREGGWLQRLEASFVEEGLGMPKLTLAPGLS